MQSSRTRSSSPGRPSTFPYPSAIIHRSMSGWSARTFSRSAGYCSPYTTRQTSSPRRVHSSRSPGAGSGASAPPTSRQREKARRAAG